MEPSRDRNEGPVPIATLEARALELLDLWLARDLWPLAIVWNRRLQTRAGVAWLAERRIELNPRLLERHIERVDEVLVHELAHLVIYARCGSAEPEHGTAWRSLIDLAGTRATRCHGMDVSGLRRSITKKPEKYWLHVCVACHGWWIGRRLRRERSCDRCGPGPVRVYTAARSPRGLERLRAFASDAQPVSSASDDRHLRRSRPPATRGDASGAGDDHRDARVDAGS